MDIIITGQQAWDVEIGSNCKNIALEFSKKNRVLYVNSPLDRISLMKNGNDPKVIKRKDVINKKRMELKRSRIISGYFIRTGSLNLSTGFHLTGYSICSINGTIRHLPNLFSGL